MPQVNLEQVELKAKDIYEARHYIYKDKELDQLANKKFAKALREGTLHQFPNVTFFLKKKENEVARLTQKLQESELSSSNR